MNKSKRTNNIFILLLLTIGVCIAIYLNTDKKSDITDTEKLDFLKINNNSILKCSNLLQNGIEEYVKGPHPLFILYIVNEKNVIFNALSFKSDYIPTTPPYTTIYTENSENMLCYGDTWFWPETIDTSPPSSINFVGDDKTVFLERIILNSGLKINFGTPLNFTDNLKKVIGYDKAFVGKIDNYSIDGEQKNIDFGTVYLIPVYQ